jgi:hypothetical protein
MANLTITIGALTGTASGPDGKAAALLSAYADSIGATGTNKQRADAVAAALVRHMQAQAQIHRANVVKAEAAAAAQTELDSLTWE